MKLVPLSPRTSIAVTAVSPNYRARDPKLGRDVAIKVLPDSLASDPERLARFEREAKVLAVLNHPNIAHIHDFEDSTGVPALVMELVEGPTLADRIARGADYNRRSAADCAADRRCAGSGARARDHPSGSETREHQGS
jgi:serine/threonine protein kinase